MKKRKMKAPAWRARPAASTPAAAPQKVQGQDMSRTMLRIVLMKQCEAVAQEIVPILRHLSSFGEELRAFVLRVPGMEDEEVKRGLAEVTRIKVALKALGRLGLPEAMVQEPDVPATPAPGSERKQ